MKTFKNTECEDGIMLEQPSIQSQGTVRKVRIDGRALRQGALYETNSLCEHNFN